MALYELLIRGKDDGTISGAHVIDYLDNGLPGLARPVQEADWPAIASEVNASLSGKVAELEAEKAELEAAKSQQEADLAITNAKLDEVEAMIDNPDLDDTATVQAIKRPLREARLDAKQREIDELEKEHRKRGRELERKKQRLADKLDQ